MKYLITARTPDAVLVYPAIGDRDRLMDAAYDAGALGVTMVALQVPA
jgi:hypothetical protein